jgi:hypothetical protein
MYTFAVILISASSLSLLAPPSNDSVKPRRSTTPQIRYDPAITPNTTGVPLGVPLAELADEAESSGQEGSPRLWEILGDPSRGRRSEDPVADSANIRRFTAAMLRKVENPKRDWRPHPAADWDWVCHPDLSDGDRSQLLVEWVERSGDSRPDNRGRPVLLRPEDSERIKSLVGPPESWKTARVSGLYVLATAGDPWVKDWAATALPLIDAPLPTPDEKRVQDIYRRAIVEASEVQAIALDPERLFASALTVQGTFGLPGWGTWAINRSLALGMDRKRVAKDISKWLEQQWSKTPKGYARRALCEYKVTAIQERWITETDAPNVPAISLHPDK